MSGKIYFTSIPSDDEMDDISYFLLEKSIKHRIGFNMNLSLTWTTLGKYPIRDYISDGYMPYEIVQAPWNGTCEKIIPNTGFAYNKETDILKDGSIRYRPEIEKAFEDIVKNSRIPDVQKFFEEIIGHEKISYIIYELEDVHFIQQEISEYEIKADQFSQEIINAATRMWQTPTVRFKIIK